MLIIHILLLIIITYNIYLFNILLYMIVRHTFISDPMNVDEGIKYYRYSISNFSNLGIYF